jgi:hypothetical protein
MFNDFSLEGFHHGLRDEPRWNDSSVVTFGGQWAVRVNHSRSRVKQYISRIKKIIRKA